MRQAYCPVCQKAYGPGPRPPAAPKPIKPKPEPITLDNVAARYAAIPSGKRWGGRASQRFRALILERDGHTCKMERDGRLCGRRATTVDHIVPRSRGGALYDPGNARAACADCNFRAGGRLTGRAPIPVELTTRQSEIVRVLDELALPADTGRRHALSVVRRAGWRPQWTNSDIDAACAWRRAHTELVRHAPPSRDW